MNRSPLHLFEGYGAELEYMIVDRQTLSVLPIADKLIHTVCGKYESEIERGKLRWSNELVLHVIELKTNGPHSTLEGLSDLFQHHIHEINHLLEPFGGVLLPTAMHPWMNPDVETRLWPHDNNIIYETYHRIFDCRGHGWSNLQSVHLNLPFADETEFGRLHAAIRLVLPILPALAASSPIVEAQSTGIMDTRMHYYCTNSQRIPSITGKVIPEAVFTFADYHRKIFQKMYHDIAPHDPDGILQNEWLNARGAIARFDRCAIEIRVLDIQECPQSDLAIVWMIVSTLKMLVGEEWCSFEEQQTIASEPLVSILFSAIQKAEETAIENSQYLRLFGIHDKREMTVHELWWHIWNELERKFALESIQYKPMIHSLLRNGSLARRIMNHLKGTITHSSLFSLCKELAACLEEGRMFLP